MLSQFHVGIDDFSCLVTFLQCSNNNQATTVLRCFRAPVVEYGFPSQVRCDNGGENIDMARLMVTTRGTDLRSVITGSSTHNQRIERLWRDLCRVLLRLFQNLFTSQPGRHFAVNDRTSPASRKFDKSVLYSFSHFGQC